MNELTSFEKEFKNTAFLRQNPKKTKKAVQKGGRAANNTVAVMRAIKRETDSGK